MAQSQTVDAVVARRGYTYRGQAIPKNRVVRLTTQQFEKAQRHQPPYFRKATPADLEDFAVGFSLTERIVRSLSEIESLEIVPSEDGIDIQMWLAKPRPA